MLVDMEENFLTQREWAAMRLLQTAIDNDHLSVYPKIIQQIN